MQCRATEANYGSFSVACFKIIASSAIPRIQKARGLNHLAYTNRPLVNFTLKWNDESSYTSNKTEDDHHSLVHSPSYEANGFSSGQEVLRILWKTKFRYTVFAAAHHFSLS